MLESPATFLIPLFTTSIAVVMATIFFCCWGRKQTSTDSEDAAAGKEKDQTTGNGNEAITTEKEQLASENGNGSTARSSSGYERDSADLGDFSVVNRETEILRSYRKPPPPKNRARQSRAPRTIFKSSQENLDIFAELTEESQSFGDSLRVNGSLETTAPVEAWDDSLDVSFLRPRPESADTEGGGPKRGDVRSSMLADIEQTLAALHSNSEDMDTKDNHIADHNNGEGKPNETEKQEVAVSIPLVTSSVDETVETTNASTTSSTDESPGDQTNSLTKPKVGPKVSPKPPRKQLPVKVHEPITKTDATKEESLQSSSELDVKAPDTTRDNKDNDERVSSLHSDEAVQTSENPTDAKPELSTTETQSEEGKHTAGKEEDTTVSKQKQTTNLSQNSKENEEESKSDDTKSDLNNTTDRQTPDNLEVSPTKSVTISDQSVPQGDSHKTNEEVIVGYDVPNKEAARPDAPTRQDSTEDTQGKGKISRIPVRAGSKPRSSPPKSDNTEETTD